MVILGVFVVLAIILTWFVVKATREERSEVNRAIEICIPIQLLGFIFIMIWAFAPQQYKEIKFETEYELASFNVNDKYDAYATLDNGTYICYLNDGNNKPMTYPVNMVSSVVYIDDNETPKICEYVQECKWTWYAPPAGKDIVTYVLYIPEGSLFYTSVQEQFE